MMGRTVSNFLMALCLLCGASACSMGDFGGKLWKSGGDETTAIAPEESSQTLTQDEAIGVATREGGKSAPSQRGAASQEGLAPSRPVPPGSADRTQTIEVLWRVPTDSVERYHVLYGSDPQKLERSVVVPVAKLQKIDHPKFGPVYRYELTKIPVDAIVFVSLRAENSAGVSPATSPVRLEPGSRSVMP